jgi:alpha-amylase
VFKKNWLQYFFTKLEENKDWLKTTTFSKYNQNHPPKGRIYLPTASYFEMSEWSLPGDVGEKFEGFVHDFEEEGRFDELKPFFKGGMWRNFLSIYDESNWMQKKMQYLSDKIETFENKKLKSTEKKNLEKAKYHMWKSSCNCTYWHGIFGGLYLPHLRHAVYQEMIISEKYLDQVEKPKSFDLVEKDVDLDGYKEILLKTNELQLAISPAKGGIIEELSLRNKNFNVLNTLKRYQEAYHAKVHLAYEEQNNDSGSIHDLVLAKEEGLDKYLNYDSHSRKMLVDHFIKKDVSLDQLQQVDYFEDSDFIDNDFDYQADKRGRKIVMTREGWVNWQKLEMTKEIRVRKNYLEFYYKLKNLGAEENSFFFGPEFNFAMLGGESPDRYYFSRDKDLEGTALISKNIEKSIKSLGVINEYDGFKLELQTDEKVDFWRFPIETVSLSEAGFERVYQSSVIIPFYDIKLIPKAEKEITLKLKISDV